MKSFSITLALTLGAAPSALAWGGMGHETVGYIAQNFVSPATKTWAQNILGDTSSSYLANVATWADTFRYTTAGTYSKPFHYVDANDSPPSSCSVVYTRDCPSAGCVIRAISNYTGRVQQKSLAASEVQNALKFLVHFIGDIHQPLHDEAIDVGGNAVAVTFNGTTTNLHAVWDTSVPETIAHGSTLATAQSYATTLTAAIKTGAYASQKSTWTSGTFTTSDAIGSATGWAMDANSFVCSTVFPGGIASVQNHELGPSGPYYNSVAPTVNVLIARAGYRLAAWLNLVATGSTGGL